VCCYGDAPQEVQVDERLAWQHPLVLIQPQWQGCRINMLHGSFPGAAPAVRVFATRKRPSRRRRCFASAC
jgi:general secretion pathway protein L